MHSIQHVYTQQASSYTCGACVLHNQTIASRGHNGPPVFTTMCTCMHARNVVAHTHTHTHEHTHTYTQTDTQTHTCTHRHTRTNTHTHRHTHTHNTRTITQTHATAHAQFQTHAYKFSRTRAHTLLFSLSKLQRPPALGQPLALRLFVDYSLLEVFTGGC